MRLALSVLTFLVLSAPAFADVPAVVTDIPPVHSLVAMVMGDLGSPVLLLHRGADAHDFQLRPSQARAVADAGLVVWIGPEMSPWLDHALQGTETAGAQLALLAVPGTSTRRFVEAEEEHAEVGDYDLGTDPHAWLDPDNAQIWIDAIATELGRLDAPNAATYAANAAAARIRIAALDRDLMARLAPVRDRPFVVFHDAIGYFAAHYRLSPAGAIASGDAAPPGARHLRDLTERAQEAACIFPEAGHDTDLPAQMAEASGARLGTGIDPEGVSLDPGPGLYPAFLTGITDTLTGCLAPE